MYSVNQFLCVREKERDRESVRACVCVCDIYVGAVFQTCLMCISVNG